MEYAKQKREASEAKYIDLIKKEQERFKKVLEGLLVE